MAVAPSHNAQNTRCILGGLGFPLAASISITRDPIMILDIYLSLLDTCLLLLDICLLLLNLYMWLLDILCLLLIKYCQHYEYVQCTYVEDGRVLLKVYM